MFPTGITLLPMLFADSFRIPTAPYSNDDVDKFISKIQKEPVVASCSTFFLDKLVSTLLEDGTQWLERMEAITSDDESVELGPFKVKKMCSEKYCTKNGLHRIALDMNGLILFPRITVHKPSLSEITVRLPMVYYGSNTIYVPVIFIWHPLKDGDAKPWFDVQNPDLMEDNFTAHYLFNFDFYDAYHLTFYYFENNILVLTTPYKDNETVPLNYVTDINSVEEICLGPTMFDNIMNPLPDNVLYNMLKSTDKTKDV